MCIDGENYVYNVDFVLKMSVRNIFFMLSSQSLRNHRDFLPDHFYLTIL